MLAYGSYEPDKPVTDPGVSPVIQNVIPLASTETGVAYKPFASFQVIPGAAALPGPPRGGISIVNPSSGNYEVYACTASAIYKLQTDYSWVAIGTGYTLPAEEEWSIVPFGNFLLFTNRSDGILQYNVAVPAGVTAVSGAPKARFLFVAFDCVFAGDCDGENRLLRNSGTNNHTQWTPGINNSQYQPIPDGQELVAGAAINDGTVIVLQRNSIRVLTRTGDTRLYTMNILAQNIGCVGARTLASIGTELFFQSTDGFYRINSQGVIPIGAQRVNATYLAAISTASFFTVQAAIDPVNKLVAWLYHPTSDTGATTNLSAGLLFSYQLDKWVAFVPEAAAALAGIFQFATPGYGMDSIDSFGTLDTLPYSLDSRFWNGGQPRLAGLSADYKIGFFDGTSMAATLYTQTVVSPTDQLFDSVVPQDDAGAGTVSIAAKDSLSGTARVTSTTTIQPSGRAFVRARGKVAQGQRTIPAGTTWTTAKGVDTVVAKKGGVR